MARNDGKETIKAFGTDFEAHMLRGRLAQEGLHPTVHRFSRYKSMAGMGYLVKVPTHELARAQAILAEIEGSGSESGGEGPPPCPACQSTDVRRTPLDTRGKWLAWCTLSLALFFMDRPWQCTACGHTWHGEEEEEEE